MSATRMQLATCQILEGLASPTAVLILRSEDGTFLTRSNIVITTVSTEYSLSARLCVPCFLYILFITHFTEEETEA